MELLFFQMASSLVLRAGFRVLGLLGLPIALLALFLSDMVVLKGWVLGAWLLRSELLGRGAV